MLLLKAKIKKLEKEISELVEQRNTARTNAGRNSIQAKIDEKNNQLRYTKEALDDARAKLESLKPKAAGGGGGGGGGGGVGPVMKAMGGLIKYSMGGKVASRYLSSGGSLGSDTIPAMLTPGEFVIKRPAVQNFGVKKLEAINSGKSSDASVYTYNVSVNVATNSDPDAIARTVVTKIRSVDKQRLGGNSY